MIWKDLRKMLDEKIWEHDDQRWQNVPYIYNNLQIIKILEGIISNIDNGWWTLKCYYRFFSHVLYMQKWLVFSNHTHPMCIHKYPHEKMLVFDLGLEPLEVILPLLRSCKNRRALKQPIWVCTYIYTHLPLARTRTCTHVYTHMHTHVLSELVERTLQTRGPSDCRAVF